MKHFDYVGHPINYKWVSGMIPRNSQLSNGYF